jgi:hypothetical protein
MLFADSSGNRHRISAASGVNHKQHNQDQFCLCRAAFYSQLKAKVGNIIAKATALRINPDIDDAPIASREHTHTGSHPSHSQKTLASYSRPFPERKMEMSQQGKYAAHSYLWKVSAGRTEYHEEDGKAQRDLSKKL